MHAPVQYNFIYRMNAKKDNSGINISCVRKALRSSKPPFEMGVTLLVDERACSSDLCRASFLGCTLLNIVWC